MVVNFMKSVVTCVFIFLLLWYVTGLINGQQNQGPTTIDVTEDQNVLLECRFSPELAMKASTLFWIRTNRQGHDNVAIGETPYQANYM